MALLTAEALLGASALKVRTVAVPEWGGEVIIGEMSGTDRDDWDLAYFAREDAEKAAAAREKRPVNKHAAAELHAARKVAWTARKPDGSDLFLVRRPNGRVDHVATEAVVARLGAKSAAVLTRLARVSDDLSAIGTGALDAAEGNSGGTPSDSPDGKQP